MLRSVLRGEPVSIWAHVCKVNETISEGQIPNESVPAAGVHNNRAVEKRLAKTKLDMVNPVSVDTVARSRNTAFVLRKDFRPSPRMGVCLATFRATKKHTQVKTKTGRAESLSCPRGRAWNQRDHRRSDFWSKTFTPAASHRHKCAHVCDFDNDALDPECTEKLSTDVITAFEHLLTWCLLDNPTTVSWSRLPASLFERLSMGQARNPPTQRTTLHASSVLSRPL